MRLPVDWKVHQPYGILHGGVSALLAESAASFGAALAAGPGRGVVGIELNASHLRSVRDGHLTAEATPLRVGRTIQVWRIAPHRRRRAGDLRGPLHVCRSSAHRAVPPAPCSRPTGREGIGSESALAYYDGVTPVGSRSAPSVPGVDPPRPPRRENSSRRTVIPEVLPERAAEVAEVCRRAEATGADSLWAVDHLFWPHPIAEPFTTLAVAAGDDQPAGCSAPASSSCPSAGPPPWPSRRPRSSSSPEGVSSSGWASASTRASTRGPVSTTTGGAGSWTRAWPRCVRPGRPSDVSDYVMEPASRPGPDLVRRVERGGPAPRRRLGRRLGPALPDARRLRGRARGAAARDGRDAGRDPEAVTAGVVVFACVGDDDQAPTQGAQWLSDLYRLPPKAFHAAPRRRLARGVCRRGCTGTSRPEPTHPRDGGRVARGRALSGCCGPRSRREERPVLTGSPA